MCCRIGGQSGFVFFGAMAEFLLVDMKLCRSCGKDEDKRDLCLRFVAHGDLLTMTLRWARQPSMSHRARTKTHGREFVASAGDVVRWKSGGHREAQQQEWSRNVEAGQTRARGEDGQEVPGYVALHPEPADKKMSDDQPSHRL